MNNKFLLKWELVGIGFVFLVGALLHFLFEWSGNSPVIGAIASVNESVWEHFKQGFWPMVLYSILEYPFIKKYASNFLTAKAAAVYLIPSFTGVTFYAYTSVIGEHILLVDIFIFLLAVVAGQLVSYRILRSSEVPAWVNKISLVLMIILGAGMVLFTFYPPHLPIFLDETGFYGLPY